MPKKKAKIRQDQFGMPFVETPDAVRHLGCLPPDPNFSAFPDFTDHFGVLPSSQWTENSLRPGKMPILNQLQHNSCTGHGTLTAFTAAKAIAGHKLEQWSATYIYGQINGGRDQGATVGNAMVAIRDKGTCFFSQVNTNMIYVQQFPPDADSTAQRFRALQAFKLNSFDELMTCMVLGIPCASGIAVGHNFTMGQLQDSGIILSPDQIVGGHCLAHIGCKNINGQWVVETQNSWGQNWGPLNGYCYLPQSAWNPNYGFPFDCFAIYSVIVDPQNKDQNVVTVIDPNAPTST